MSTASQLISIIKIPPAEKRQHRKEYLTRYNGLSSDEIIQRAGLSDSRTDRQRLRSVARAALVEELRSASAPQPTMLQTLLELHKIRPEAASTAIFQLCEAIQSLPKVDRAIKREELKTLLGAYAKAGGEVAGKIVKGFLQMMTDPRGVIDYRLLANAQIRSIAHVPH